MNINQNQFIEYIEDEGITLAILLHKNFKDSGIHFLTPDDYSQQLAYMNHPKGKVIPPHVHNPVNRSVTNTLEVLFIKTGSLKIDFYSGLKEYLKSKVLNTGDIILLVSGGHGFEMLEQSEIIEVKQGPYAGEHDKTRFEPHKHD